MTGKQKDLERELLGRNLKITNAELEELAKKHGLKLTTAKTLLSALIRWNDMARGLVSLNNQHIEIISAIRGNNREVSWSDIKKMGITFHDKVLGERLSELCLFGLIKKSKNKKYYMNKVSITPKILAEIKRQRDINTLKNYNSDQIIDEDMTTLYGFNISDFSSLTKNEKKVSAVMDGREKLYWDGLMQDDLFQKRKSIGLVDALKIIIKRLYEAKLEIRYDILEKCFDGVVQKYKCSRKIKNILREHKVDILHITNDTDVTTGFLKKYVLTPIIYISVFYRNYQVSTKFADLVMNANEKEKDEIIGCIMALINATPNFYPTRISIVGHTTNIKTVSTELTNSYNTVQQYKL